MYIKVGDIVEVLGIDEDTQDNCLWWGEIMEYIPETRVYYIYYISDHHGIWKYNETCDVIVKENINRHSKTKRGNYEEAWSKFGFEMIRNRDDIHFIKTDQEEYTDTDCSEETLSSVDTWSSMEETETLPNFIDDTCCGPTLLYDAKH